MRKNNSLECKYGAVSACLDSNCSTCRMNYALCSIIHRWYLQDASGRRSPDLLVLPKLLRGAKSTLLAITIFEFILESGYRPPLSSDLLAVRFRVPAFILSEDCGSTGAFGCHSSDTSVGTPLDILAVREACITSNLGEAYSPGEAKDPSQIIDSLRILVSRSRQFGTQMLLNIQGAENRFFKPSAASSGFGNRRLKFDRAFTL